MQAQVTGILGAGLEGLAGAGLAGVELYDIEDAIVVPSGSIVLMHSFGSLYGQSQNLWSQV